MTYTHKEQYESLTIKILAEDSPENPFTSWDCEPDIIGWHRRYDFNTRKEDKNKSPEQFLKEAKENGYIVKPLFMYDHSGISFSTSSFSCQWDSGQYGFIFWTRDKIRQRQGEFKRISKAMREKLNKQLDSSVKLLNDYVSGNVYGYQIEDEDGNHLESCYGFYGDYDSEYGVLSEARSVAKYLHESLIKERAQHHHNLGLTLGLTTQQTTAA